MATNDGSQPIAVWLFVGATMVGALPMLLLPDAPWWLRLAFVAAAFACIVAGFARLRVERAHARRATGDAPE